MGQHLNTFLRIAAANVGRVPGVADEVAKRRLGELGYTLGKGWVHGQNDCLADSLLQCMCAAEVLPARFAGGVGSADRAAACNAAREHLIQSSDEKLQPRPWNCFLMENVHGPHIALFFLSQFGSELLTKPAELEIVVHSRFDSCVQEPGTVSAIVPATTVVPTVFGGDRITELHMYCETGEGSSGIHFSPILWIHF